MTSCSTKQAKMQRTIRLWEEMTNTFDFVKAILS